MLADDILRRNLIQLKKIRDRMGEYDKRYPAINESIKETEQYLAEFVDPVPVPAVVEPAVKAITSDEELAAAVEKLKADLRRCLGRLPRYPASRVIEDFDYTYEWDAYQPAEPANLPRRTEYQARMRPAVRRDIAQAMMGIDGFWHEREEEAQKPSYYGLSE